MKLKYLDSIRGIAILMVILVHVSQNVNLQNPVMIFLTNYGQLGVQLFFVASAYTLCLSSEKRQNERNHNLKYAIRRYFRIAPAYYIAILIYFIIRVLFDKIVTGTYVIPEQYNFINIFSNVSFFHGFYEPGNNTIVPGGWSIGTEMAFYAIFPILFKIAKNSIWSIKNIIFFAVIGIFVCYFILLMLCFNGIVVTKNYFLYFSLINQLPVFLIGISYFFFREKLKLDWNHQFDFIFFLLLTGLSLFAFYMKLNFIFPTIAALSFVFLIEVYKKYDFLNTRLLMKIGKVSFSMYLLHFIFAFYLTPFLSSKIDVGNGVLSLIIFYLFSHSLKLR